MLNLHKFLYNLLDEWLYVEVKGEVMQLVVLNEITSIKIMFCTNLFYLLNVIYLHSLQTNE